MIIGLTGRNASGKGTVAAWLEKQGFGYTSLSDAIRLYLTENGQETSRDNLIAAGTALRQEGGAGVLAERTLRRIPLGVDFVVDSIRNPAEVEALRHRADFVLLEVAANEAVRYERLASRGRTGDAQSLAEFRRHEEAELSSGDPSAQQLLATAAMADVVVDNDGDIDALHGALTLLLPMLRKRVAA
jgi:dephospho-CoA kinase